MSQYVKAFNLFVGGMFYKNVGDFTWRVSDCEEIVGQIQFTVNLRLLTNCFA